MRLTIDLNTQLLFQTGEINDVWTEGDLATKPLT